MGTSLWTVVWDMADLLALRATPALQKTKGLRLISVSSRAAFRVDLN
jgi:hypothetical protein